MGDGSSPPEADQHLRGGRVRLARPDHYPIETGYDEDPVRALIGAAGDLVGDEEILVQVAVRPITGARLRRAGRAAHRLRQTTPETADPFAPGHRPRRHGPSPEASSEIRAIVHKATQPRLETHIRYLISSSGDGEQARQARRGRSHALAAAFAVFSGYNHHQRRRMLLAPLWLATMRSMGHGDLLTAAEPAAVAHLPLDEIGPGCSTRRHARFRPRPRWPPTHRRRGCWVWPSSPSGAPSPNTPPMRASTPTSSAEPAPARPPC